MDDEPRPRNVVIGQPVTETKVILSRQMRREMTAEELILWSRLRRNGAGPQFRRQQIIDGFIADFYCHAAALVVEVDSPSHDPEYDKERDRVFAERGILVYRCKNEDVNARVGWVLRQIRDLVSRRLPTPTPDSVDPPDTGR